jgi:hypothetical protein
MIFPSGLFQDFFMFYFYAYEYKYA